MITKTIVSIFPHKEQSAKMHWYLFAGGTGYSAYLVPAPKTMALTIVARFISHVI
jgi:hypothetical protein